MLRYPKYKESEQDDINDIVIIKGKIFTELYYMGLDAADFVEKFQTGPLADKWDRRGKGEYLCWHWSQSARAFDGELYRKYGIELKKADPAEYCQLLRSEDRSL